MIELKENLKELIFVYRWGCGRRTDRLRLSFVKRGEKFSLKKRHYYGDERKKYLQSVFNTKHDELFKYAAYKSGFLGVLTRKYLVALEYHCTAFKNYVVYFEKTTLN